MKYFYARVSSKEQNLARQLKAADSICGIDRVFCDKLSGKDFNRPAYQEMKSVLSAGDELYILSLDRLGRDYDDIGVEWEDITKKIGADIIVLDCDILDTRKYRDLAGQLIADIILKLFSYVAESERQKIKTRQREGIDAMPVVGGKRVSAKTGKGFGREAVIPCGFDSVYDLFARGRISADRAMKELGVSKSTFYRLVKRAAA